MKIISYKWIVYFKMNDGPLDFAAMHTLVASTADEVARDAPDHLAQSLDDGVEGCFEIVGVAALEG